MNFGLPAADSGAVEGGGAVGEVTEDVCESGLAGFLRSDDDEL